MEISVFSFLFLFLPHSLYFFLYWFLLFVQGVFFEAVPGMPLAVAARVPAPEDLEGQFQQVGQVGADLGVA